MGYPGRKTSSSISFCRYPVHPAHPCKILSGAPAHGGSFSRWREAVGVPVPDAAPGELNGEAQRRVSLRGDHLDHLANLIARRRPVHPPRLGHRPQPLPPRRTPPHPIAFSIHQPHRSGIHARRTRSTLSTRRIRRIESIPVRKPLRVLRVLRVLRECLYFPTQKRAKISVIVASVTDSPVISPRASAAIFRSTATMACSKPAATVAIA
jgi:hypothetical protein